MNFSSPTDQASGARLWYRRLAACYPASFREHHGEEMIRMFDEDWQSACAQGAGARRRYAWHVVWDALRTLPKELYSVAPGQWLGFVIAAGTLKFLSFWDLRIGCCALVFFAFHWGMLKFVLRFGTGFKLLLAGLWAPFGYGLARFMGYAGVWAMQPRGHLDSDMVMCFAGVVFIYVIYLVLWKNERKKIFVDGTNDIAVMLGGLALGVGLSLGGAGWKPNPVWFSFNYANMVVFAGLQVYFKIWRGALISGMGDVSTPTSKK